MSRYIDADALWMDIIHAMDYCEDILQIIESQPTSDVRKNVHGEWLESNLIKDGRIFICSNCNMAWVSKKRTMDGMNYCPNCGADMREGETNGFNQKARCD